MNAAFQVHQLSDLATSIDYGVTASASDIDNGTKFLRITDIQDGAVDWQTVPFCEAAPGKLRSAQLSDGDIVFARTGATTGKSFLIQSPPDGAVVASYLNPHLVEVAGLARVACAKGWKESVGRPMTNRGDAPLMPRGPRRRREARRSDIWHGSLNGQSNVVVGGRPISLLAVQRTKVEFDPLRFVCF